MEILLESQLDYFEVKEWKRRYFVMKYEISSALRYIEIYKDKNWHKQLPRHVVNLHPGYEVRRREDPKKKNCFSVRTTDHVLVLGCEDENIVNHWLATLEEYNLVKSFCVQPQDTPTMVKIEAVFPCHLQLVHSEVRLVSAMDGKLLGLWPFKCIRRYKFVGNLFSIEAGRKAPTGEGIFEFVSNECSEIYRVMDTIIRTKAGSGTVRRLASEKMPSQARQCHQPVRKVNSVPVEPSLPRKDQNQYEYADPAQNVPSRKPDLPPLPIPSEAPAVQTEATYDILSPGEMWSGGNDFDRGDVRQGESPVDNNSYDTLQFKDARYKETNRTPQLTGSPGSYDTLRFNAVAEMNSAKQEGQTLKGCAGGSYDTLQFSKRASSLEDVRDVENGLNDDGNLPQSGGFYNTLNLSSPQLPGSASKAVMQDNTYDSLNALNEPSLREKDAYDCLGSHRHLQHDTQKQSTAKMPPVVDVGIPMGSEKPVAPQRPPPRAKFAKQNATAGKKVPVVGKAERPLKPVRKLPPAGETREEQNPKALPEKTSDIIQRKLAEASQRADDGNYATVNHEYASIDYSKVNCVENTLSSGVYAEPDEVDAKEMKTSKLINKLAKKSHAAPLRNIFKKAPPLPPRAKGETDEKFSDELKKKLEIKLRKSGDTASGKTSSNNQTRNDDGIYDEVDDSNYSNYSEPFANDEMNV